MEGSAFADRGATTNPNPSPIPEAEAGGAFAESKSRATGKGVENDDVVEPGSGGATSSGAPAAAENGTSNSGGNGGGSNFECNICLELAQDPVVTLCGHLFCWPCLYRWLQMHAHLKDCPVCKAGVDESKVIPLYGRGNVGATDPRTKPVPGPEIPHRPPGQRTEATRTAHPNQNFSFMAGPAGPYASAQLGNFTVSAGFGLFPSLFGLQFQAIPTVDPGLGSATSARSPATQQPMTSEQQQQACLSRLLLLLGSFVILCLLFF